MESQTFVFFGTAGSGKGTQTKLLSDFLKNKDNKDLLYISPGVEYRKLIESDNFTSTLVKGPLHRGELLPGFLTDAIVANILIPNLSPDKHIITDGYPRAVEQSMAFEEMVNFYQRKNIKIIYINISKEEAIQRMKLRNRHDDTEEGMTKRFDEYKNNVMPAMEYFKNKENYTIYTIDGEQGMDNVHREIITALGL